MKNVSLIICLLIATTQFNQAQILTSSPCYTVATNNGQSNVLFEYDPDSNTWLQVGITGTNFIRAIAIDALSGIMYAAEGPGGSQGINGAFGIIDPSTGSFQKIGEVGIGNGLSGSVNLNNIHGLSFDPLNQIMYATHRVEGEGAGTNDLLFQIDLSTGAFVPNAMVDNYTGFPTDYSVIPEIFDGESNTQSYDVSDIAYNAYSGELFALHTKNNGGVISVLETYTAEIEQIVYDFFTHNVGGLTFTYLGELYATTNSSLLFIDLQVAEAVPLNQIDITGENTGFESLDCDVARNDLALKITLDESTTLPIKPGDILTCQITIYNQGDIDNFDIMLTNYLPSGITLTDASWIATPNGLAIKTITEPLLSGASITIPITLKVEETYNGTSITNAAEITSSYNPDITDNFGNPIPLPDIDSVPNDRNDEVNVVDDTITGNGPDANEDEDDHDIVLFQFNNEAENILNLTGLIDEGVYLARQTIISDGQLKSSTTVLFKAGNEIILQKGFNVEPNTFFDAEIDIIE